MPTELSKRWSRGWSSPATTTVVEGGIDVQTERVLDNVKAVLEAAGCSFADVVKTTIFLTDMGEA